MIGLVLGSLLAIGTGWRRITGLVLLSLIGLIMVIASIGEFVSGNPFSGARLALFYGFSGAHGVLAAVLVATSLAALVQQRRASSPGPVDDRDRGWPNDRNSV